MNFLKLLMQIFSHNKMKWEEVLCLQGLPHETLNLKNTDKNYILSCSSTYDTQHSYRIS